MFEKLIKELKNLDGMQLSIPVHADKEGYIDKECPDEECMYQFKVDESDWKNLFKDEGVFCPMCGNVSTSDTFFTTEQVNEARDQGVAYIQGKIGTALREGVKDFNRKLPKGGFFSMTMSVKGTSPEVIILPIPAKEVLEQKIQCEKCKSRYAVIGSAFFCPCCGHNSAEQTFDNNLINISASIDHLPYVRKALNDISKDQAENTCRTLIEKGLTDCVVAFQRFCEVTYKNQEGSKTNIRPNDFQILEKGGNLWKDLLGTSYQDWLNQKEYERLNVLFQRRHLLQHTEGIVDEKYLNKSGDKKYKEGQRIVIKEKDVKELVAHIEKLAEAIRREVGKLA